MVNPELEHKEFHLNPQEPIKEKREKIYYLAHPFSAPTKQERIDNLLESIKKTDQLIQLGFNIFNPLAHSYLQDFYIPKPESFWYDLDLKILERMDGLILTPNWQKSKGCKMEFERATELQLEILDYEELIG